MASLAFENVSYRYAGRDGSALDGVTVALPSNEKIALIGRNGSGKSTFFLHCNGVLKPSSGAVLLNGVAVDYGRAGLKKLRQTVGIVFQQADDQLFSASIEQDISFGPLNLGLSEAEARERVAEVMMSCDIRHLEGRPIHALSGGEKARVALAGVLAMRPEIILVDEPTASLDPLMRQQVFKIFDRLIGSGKTVVVATHEYEVARFWADFVVVMDQGKVLAAGYTDEVFGQVELLEKIGLNRPWYEDVFDTDTGKL